MTFYTMAVVLHVVVAVLGVGQVGALAIAASSARRCGMALLQTATWIRPLFRSTRWSLAAMVGTGIWIDVAVGGVHHDAWWVRLSGILIVVTFLFHRRALAAISRVVRGEDDAAAAFRRVERAAWSMCSTVALITMLMEAAILMSEQRATEDLAVFESHRPALIGLAYRMLGDVGRAQDMVQESWLRWHRREVEVESPKAFLVTVVTRLC